MGRSPKSRRELNLYKNLLFERLKVRIGDDFVPYTVGLSEHPGQKKIHFEEWLYGVLDWGRRTGKTIGAAAECVSELGLPERRIWIVAPNYELTYKVFEYVYRWVVLEECFGPGSVAKASRTRDNRYIEMAWGSFVKGKSGESPDSMLGDQLDLIIFDECARCGELIWLEALEPTTIDRKGRVLFISTPRGKNWFYDYYLRGQDETLGTHGWMSSRFKTADNPFTDKDWLESKRDQTPELVWRREYEASFEDFGGRIYPEFKARTGKRGHLYDPDEIQLSGDWPVYRGIDIGFRLPTACVWSRVDEDNNVWIYKEYQQEGTIHEDHAENIKALTGEGVYQTYISPDASRRFGTSQVSADANSPLRIYQRHGVFARTANDDFGLGTSLLARYIRASLEDHPTHPCLFVSMACPMLIRALEEYQYLEVKNRSELDQPEKPRKKDDHLPDALRYLVTANPRYLRTWRTVASPGYDDDVVRYGLQGTKSAMDAHKRRTGGGVRQTLSSRTKIAGLS